MPDSVGICDSVGFSICILNPHSSLDSAALTGWVLSASASGDKSTFHNVLLVCHIRLNLYSEIADFYFYTPVILLWD